MLDTLIEELRGVLPAEWVITDPVRLRTYECDGLTYHRATPGVVVLPETAEQVARVVRLCGEFAVPFVARGSGTGLSGGANALKRRLAGPIVPRRPVGPAGGGFEPGPVRRSGGPVRRGPSRSRRGGCRAPGPAD